MAENQNEGSTGSLRQGQSGKRRREPPIIDAKATDVTPTAAPHTDPQSEPEQHASATESVATPEEPVLFGQVLRGAHAASADPTAKAETEAASPPATGDVPDPVPEPQHVAPAQTPNAPTGSSPPDGPVEEPTLSQRDATSLDETPPALGFGSPRGSQPPPRSSTGVLLGSTAVLLLLVIAGWLILGPSRGEGDGLKAELEAANRRLSALEARPDTAPLAAQVTQLDQRTTAANADISALRAASEDLRKRLDEVTTTTQAAAATSGATGASADQLAALSGRIDDLSHKIEVLPTPVAAVQPGPTVDLGPVEGKVADVSRRIDELQAAVASLPRVDVAPIETALGEASRRIDGLDQGLKALRASVAAIPKVNLEPLKAAIAAEEQRIAPLEAQLAAPKSAEHVTEARAVGNADAARAAPLAVVAAQAGKRIDAGQSLTTEVDALRSLGIDAATLAPLSAVAETGAPTVSALKAQWSDIEPSVSQATRPRTGDGLLDKFAAGAFQIVKVRRVGAPTGEDPGSIIARISASLNAGNVGAAFADWSKLPDAGRAASQAWAEATKRRLDAVAAAEGLASGAIETLAKSKS